MCSDSNCETITQYRQFVLVTLIGVFRVSNEHIICTKHCVTEDVETK